MNSSDKIVGTSIYGQKSNYTTWLGALLKNDKDWACAMPPSGNANYSWVQHFIHPLSLTGLGGHIFANGLTFFKISKTSFQPISMVLPPDLNPSQGSNPILTTIVAENTDHD